MAMSTLSSTTIKTAKTVQSNLSAVPTMDQTVQVGSLGALP
jgi:hypothetical protein